ncbi:MAG: leucine-rich repeat domain-containing protein [Candidatus Lokiarchaeota archaeon]
MAVNNATIMGSERLLEIELNIVTKCGINRRNYIENKQILTKEALESSWENILPIKCDYSNYPFNLLKVLGVLILQTGSKFPNGLRSYLLKILNWEEEKEFWEMYPQYLEERKFYIYDYISKILKFKQGHPVNLIDLKQHGDVDFGKVCIGVDDMKSKIASNLVYQITNLNLDSCDLDHFPNGLAKFQNLSTLSLEYNKIKEIPKEILELKKLKQLYISNNHLFTLPNYISELNSLEVLDLHRNLIKELPKSIVNLNNLIDIDLRFNQLESISKSLKMLHLNSISIHRFKKMGFWEA